MRKKISVRELPNLYIKAAELVAKNKERYSCAAVAHLAGDDTMPVLFYAGTMANRHEMLRVSDIYEASGVEYELPLPLLCNQLGLKKHAKLRDFRVLLLCIMAAACGDLYAS